MSALGQTSKNPTGATISPDDRGARVSHLLDTIEAAARPLYGLDRDFHDVAGAGAMRSPHDDGIVLVTILTAEGNSHTYAMDRQRADHLRDQLIELRPHRARPYTAKEAAR